tara:strand:+ start:797 stop:1660 length:864 start_codon:yes stop_codon:yes gene_type:complete
MIVVRLYGGLGNQLFQYATARRLTKNLRTDLVLDISSLEKTVTGITTREYELWRYPIRARLLSSNEKRTAKLFTNKILKRLPLQRPWSLQKEKYYHFDPRILNLGDNIYLDGYWQSHKYFKDVEDTIRLELTTKEPMGIADQSVFKDICANASVALHVRRGDYVSVENVAQTHGVCSLKYYQNAIDFMKKKVKNPKFFIFSDDPDWVRENIFTGSSTFYVDHNGPDTAFQDLRLISLCRHQIIANSSFSWWGAWLNSNSKKFVIAPRTWFLDARDTRDMCPENWIKL